MDALEQLLNSASYEKAYEKQSFSIDEIAKSPALQKIVRDRGGMNHNMGGGDIQSSIAGIILESKGDLNLTVIRTGNSINTALPFVLFGANDFAAKYFATLSNLLAQVNAVVPGTTVAVTVSVGGNIVFTYTNGMNVDVVTVLNLGNIPLANFMASMNNNYFATKFCEVTLSDPTKANAQFAFPFFYGVLSSLGANNANQIVFRSRSFSWSFRPEKIELLMPEQTIAPDFSFAMAILPVDGLSIGFDFFMSKRLNLNKAV